MRGEEAISVKKIGEQKGIADLDCGYVQWNLLYRVFVV